MQSKVAPPPAFKHRDRVAILKISMFSVWPVSARSRFVFNYTMRHAHIPNMVIYLTLSPCLIRA